MQSQGSKSTITHNHPPHCIYRERARSDCSKAIIFICDNSLASALGDVHTISGHGSARVAGHRHALCTPHRGAHNTVDVARTQEAAAVM